MEQHEMQLVKTHTSDAEEWYCPTCERRFIVRWPPRYKKIILNPGNEYAAHSGGKGGLLLRPPQLHQSGEEEPNLSETWYSAFDDLDFDWSGDLE